MIFRKTDYTPSEPNTKFESLIKDVKAFAQKIAPKDKKKGNR